MFASRVHLREPAWRYHEIFLNLHRRGTPERMETIIHQTSGMK
jgi:hypothetical protein